MSQTLYELLGVAQDADAKEIKKVFRTIAKAKHPDVCHEPNAAEEFIKFQEAYDILSNEELRKAYDEELANAGTHELRFDSAFMDMMDSFIRRRKGYQSPIKGRSYEFPLHVGVEDLLQNRMMEVPVEMIYLCVDCTGTGEVESVEACPHCKGEGGKPKVTMTPFGKLNQRVPCDACFGTGKKEKATCPTCAGHKQMKATKKLRVRLTNESNFGDEIVFKGAGAPGLSGGSDGDVTFTLYHSGNDGYSILYDTDVEKVEYVRLEDMLMGNTITLTLPNGKPKNVQLLEHFQNPNNKAFFPGEGLYKDGKRGSYSARLVVDFSKLDADVREKLIDCLKVNA